MTADNPVLKEILDFKQIEKLFENFSRTSKLDVVLYDTKGEPQLAARHATSICELGKPYFGCGAKIVQSGQKAEDLGEAYIYETPCGLIMCVTPLVIEGVTAGYITTGPVVLWEKDEYFAAEFEKKCAQAGLSVDKTDFDVSSIPYIDCKSILSIAETLTVLIAYVAGEEKKYIRQRLEISERNAEHARVVKEMQLKPSQPHFDRYPDELEKELITFVQMGDRNQAKQIINKFLDEIFSYAGGDLDVVKAKLYEFTAFLSRSAVETGVSISALTSIIKKSSKMLLEKPDFFDICRETVEILDGFLDAVYAVKNNKSTSKHLYNAIQYINSRYAEQISLETLSKSIFLSPYYLSHLFRAEMNTTFSDYLNRTRIHHAKDLLLEGHSVETVAERVGYSDGNYFIKTFKKYVGLTPSKYRKVIMNL